MRAAAVLAVLVVAGCGGGRSAQPAHTPAKRPPLYVTHRVAVPPAERNGYWVKLFLSPDLKWWLGQWSGECEVQTAYLIPTHGGKPIDVFGTNQES